MKEWVIAVDVRRDNTYVTCEATNEIKLLLQIHCQLFITLLFRDSLSDRDKDIGAAYEIFLLLRALSRVWRYC
jgi:hypothetical protein